MRVSDILDLLAAGVSTDDILTDYPYLERDEEHSRERRESKRRLSSGKHRQDTCEPDREGDDDGLGEPEVRDASCVVLAPTPDREGRVASRLEPDRPLPESADRVPGGAPA